jgi:hypothetical protein
MRIGLRPRVSISVSQRRLAGEEHAEVLTGLRTVNRRVMVTAAKWLLSFGGPTGSEFPSACRSSLAAEPNGIHRIGQV